MDSPTVFHHHSLLPFLTPAASITPMSPSCGNSDTEIVETPGRSDISDDDSETFVPFGSIVYSNGTDCLAINSIFKTPSDILRTIRPRRSLESLKKQRDIFVKEIAAIKQQEAINFQTYKTDIQTLVHKTVTDCSEISGCESIRDLDLKIARLKEGHLTFGVETARLRHIYDLKQNYIPIQLFNLYKELKALCRKVFEIHQIKPVVDLDYWQVLFHESCDYLETCGLV